MRTNLAGIKKFLTADDADITDIQRSRPLRFRSIQGINVSSAVREICISWRSMYLLFSETTPSSFTRPRIVLSDETFDGSYPASMTGRLVDR
jgi:hypothetical protein